jgi:hypothetical protein
MILGNKWLCEKMTESFLLQHPIKEVATGCEFLLENLFGLHVPRTVRKWFEHLPGISICHACSDGVSCLSLNRFLRSFVLRAFTCSLFYTMDEVRFISSKEMQTPIRDLTINYLLQPLFCKLSLKNLSSTVPVAKKR